MRKSFLNLFTITFALMFALTFFQTAVAQTPSTADHEIEIITTRNTAPTNTVPTAPVVSVKVGVDVVREFSDGTRRLMNTGNNVVVSGLLVTKNIVVVPLSLVKIDVDNVTINGGVAPLICSDKQLNLAAYWFPGRTEAELLELAPNSPGGQGILSLADKTFQTQQVPVIFNPDDKGALLRSPIPRSLWGRTFGSVITRLTDGKILGITFKMGFRGSQNIKDDNVESSAVFLITADTIQEFMQKNIVKTVNGKKTSLAKAVPVPGSMGHEFAKPGTTQEELAVLTEKTKDDRSGLQKFFSRIFGGNKKKQKNEPDTN